MGINLIKVLCVTSIIAFCPAAAQLAPGSNASLVPTQILTAKKVFISNGGSTVLTDPPDLTYEVVCANLKSRGKYDLVPAPADADLVLEVFYSEPIKQVIKGDSITDPQLRLVIRDPKSDIVLSTITEHPQRALLDSNRRKNFDIAVTALVDQLMMKVGGPLSAKPVSPAATQKSSSHLW
jgi:hypothetical protein